MRKILMVIGFIPAMLCGQSLAHPGQWEHLSSSKGDFELPFEGKQQTSCIVADVDMDGFQEIFVAERTRVPSVVMYKHSKKGWKAYVVCNTKIRLEAGGDCWDLDADGDLDLVIGGGGGSSDLIWWENPGSKIRAKEAWNMHYIKRDGGRKHHDILFGDFDGDDAGELVFWNQKAMQLCLAEIPENPGSLETWDYTAIYRYSKDSQMEQIGQADYPKFKGNNEHEGLAGADIDGDGIQDIVAGGAWFKHAGDGQYVENTIDASYRFTRTAAGQLIEGGRPEVVLVVGDGLGPLRMYEWREGTWYGKTLVEGIENGHSLAVVDFNGDGYLDIFNAEMRLNGENPDAVMRVLLGDGKGGFKDHVISTGFGNHESQMLDLDGDGDLDIVGKPYNWDVPRLDIFINQQK